MKTYQENSYNAIVEGMENKKKTRDQSLEKVERTDRTVARNTKEVSMTNKLWMVDRADRRLSINS